MIAKRILANIGINPERLRLEWVSAGEGTRFAEVQNELSAKIKSLGALGSSEGKEIAVLQDGLQAATDLVPYIKLVERERFRVQERKEENYHKLFGSAEFDKLFRELVLDKLAMSRIMRYARPQPMEAEEIAAGLNLPGADVFRHLNVLAQRGMVKLDGNQVQVVAVA
jgi:hypothetical protein